MSAGVMWRGSVEGPKRRSEEVMWREPVGGRRNQWTEEVIWRGLVGGLKRLSEGVKQLGEQLNGQSE